MRWAACVGAALLGLSLAAQAQQPTTLREAEGASVAFPGPPGYIETRQGLPGEPQHWSQAAPAWDDPDRSVALTVMRPPWWLGQLMATAPDAMLLRLEDRITALMERTYGPGGGAQSSYDQTTVNGHTALDIALERPDVGDMLARPGSQSALITQPRHARTLVLWTGTAFALATVTGSREVLDDDPFLASFTTRVAGVPGDVEAQEARLDRLALIAVLVGLAVVALLLLALVLVVRRWRRRRSRTIAPA